VSPNSLYLRVVRARSVRDSLAVLALGCTLVLSACGGSTKKVDAPTLPPANPEAVGEMVKGVQAARETDGTKQAIQHFEQALKTDAKLWEAHYNLGIVLAGAGDLARAEASLSTAAKLAPNAEDVLGGSAPPGRR
jgi:cytochrome c-type biogenesis protein CcmH/NrfG